MMHVRKGRAVLELAMISTFTLLCVACGGDNFTGLASGLNDLTSGQSQSTQEDPKSDKKIPNVPGLLGKHLDCDDEDKSKVATVMKDRKLLCHRTGREGHNITLMLPDSAVRAHLAHGDKLGDCEKESDDRP